jgi:Flp pilus assembly protein TadD
LQELTEATPAEDMLMFIRLDNDQRQLDLLNALGTALLERGLNERAWEMFERAKLRRPWQATLYLGAAKALHRLGRTDEALADIELALGISPDVPELQQLRADLADRVRDDSPSGP